MGWEERLDLWQLGRVIAATVYAAITECTPERAVQTVSKIVKLTPRSASGE